MNESSSRAGQTGRPGAPRARPLIAVSREHGARGAAVARLVAERMSFTLWDRELVAAIAAHVRAEPAHVAALDERLHEPGGDEPTGADRIGRAEYLRGLELVAQALVRRGGAVVVGRGVGFIVEADACLRVRVVCPLEQRIAGLAERAKLSRESARATIEYVDSGRRAFIQQRHGVDLEEPSTFDLVVSTGGMSVDAAADVIVGAYHARFDLRRWPRSTAASTRELRSLANDRR